MALYQTPPPPQNTPAPVPAQIQRVSPTQAQQKALSPEQKVTNDINAGKFGKGFTASTSSSTQQNIPNTREATKDIGSITKGVQDAKNQRNINNERSSALNRAKTAPAQRPEKQPSANKGIEAAKQKSTAHAKSSEKTFSSNKGISSFQNKSNSQSAVSATKGSSNISAQSGQSR